MFSKWLTIGIHRDTRRASNKAETQMQGLIGPVPTTSCFEAHPIQYTYERRRLLATCNIKTIVIELICYDIICPCSALQLFALIILRDSTWLSHVGRRCLENIGREDLQKLRFKTFLGAGGPIFEPLGMWISLDFSQVSSVSFSPQSCECDFSFC